MNGNANPPLPPTLLAYRAFRIGFWAFPALFLAAFYYLHNPQTTSHWTLALLLLAPWLACAPRVSAPHRTGLLWFSLVALVYLLALLSNVGAPWPKRAWLLAEAFVLCFCVSSALLYLRASKPPRTPKSPPPAPHNNIQRTLL